MSSNKIKTMVTAAFFVALDIIVTRYLGFEFPSPMGPIKFDFQMVVAALCGYALGPVWGCLTLITSDLLGVMLNSGTLGMFFGFTVSAMMRGLLFGFFLHNKQIKPTRIILSIALVFIPVDLFLNTLWLSMLIGTPYFPLLVSRIIPKMILMMIEMAVVLCMPKLFTIVRLRKE
ncbi:MAG: folate family ECF transporter S component [Oscillospiraceae bacterium]